MRKNSFWAFLFSMLFFSIVEDDAGGDGDEDLDDIGDFEIEDDDLENDDDKKEDKKEDEKSEPPNDEVLKELESLKAFQEQVEAEKAVVAAVSEISKEYPDFDIEKITEHLKALPKEEQERYNDPKGWELIHLKHFHKQKAAFDPFDSGRGATKEPFDFDKAYEKLEKGDRSVMADLIANSR